jgi:hypothetical protein
MCRYWVRFCEKRGDVYFIEAAERLTMREGIIYI